MSSKVHELPASEAHGLSRSREWASENEVPRIGTNQRHGTRDAVPLFTRSISRRGESVTKDLSVHRWCKQKLEPRVEAHLRHSVAWKRDCVSPVHNSAETWLYRATKRAVVNLTDEFAAKLTIHDSR